MLPWYSWVAIVVFVTGVITFALSLIYVEWWIYGTHKDRPMTDHTPGRLTVDPRPISAVQAHYAKPSDEPGGYDLVTEDGTAVATCAEDLGAIRRRADAERLAALWNACNGLPTEDLVAIGEIQDRRTRLKTLMRLANDES